MIAYHRPDTIEQALSLLQSDHCIVLAGGTVVNRGRPSRSDEVVDIQALELGAVTHDGETAVIGATARLQDLVEDQHIPPVIRQLARAELPSTLRTMATVGGTVAVGPPDSGLVAGLLVHDAKVTVVSQRGDSVVSLEDLDREGLARSIITSIQFTCDGRAAAARTGRTPADVPIVSAVGRRGDDGTVRLALTGVAANPVLADPSDPTANLEPIGDFRGSARYRLNLVEVLAERVLAEVG